MKFQKIFLHSFLLFTGLALSYWAILEWKQTGFLINMNFRDHNGNIFFIMLLIGIALVAFAAGKFFELLKESETRKNNLRS